MRRNLNRVLRHSIGVSSRAQRGICSYFTLHCHFPLKSGYSDFGIFFLCVSVPPWTRSFYSISESLGAPEGRYPVAHGASRGGRMHVWDRAPEGATEKPSVASLYINCEKGLTSVSCLLTSAL